MPSLDWIARAWLSWAAASGLFMLAVTIAVRWSRQPAQQVRLIEVTLVGLTFLPLSLLLPGYPRLGLWGPREASTAEIETPANRVRSRPLNEDEPARTVESADAGLRARERESDSAKEKWPAVLLVIWTAGGCLSAGWVILGSVVAARVRRDAQPARARARALLRSVAGPASDRVELLESSGVRQPCAFGLLRPVIVLPRGFGIRNATRPMCWALAHEWSHVRRGDLRSWLLCVLIGSWYYYQPLYWYLRRQLYLAQDFLADAGAAERDACSAEDYAEFLVQSAWAERPPVFGLGMGGSPSDLPRRIVMLVERGAKLERRISRRGNGVVWACGLGMMAAAAMLLTGPPSVAQAPGQASPSAPAPAKKPIHRLSYHDGKADGRKSIAGTGEMVAFTAPADGTRVAAVRIHGSRYGHPQAPKEDFLVYLLSADGTEVLTTKPVPYSRFNRGEARWEEIRFSKPVEVPREFWVCVDFRAAPTKGVYVSTDSSTDGSHSRVGLPGGEPGKANIEGDWMIEVVLAK